MGDFLCPGPKVHKPCKWSPQKDGYVHLRFNNWEERGEKEEEGEGASNGAIKQPDLTLVVAIVYVVAAAAAAARCH